MRPRLVWPALAVLALAACSPPVDPGKVQPVEAAQLAATFEAGNVRLIDVRSDREVAEGMIPGAEHIPIDQFDPARLDLSDGRAVVFYCHSGRRSARAAEQLSNLTGKKERHLDGGIEAWQAAGLPVSR
ncbi:MAG: rhodanese-like domain-containing protein [Erythrobacter sp.]|nr:rhodanese-like domain-containing protein [Erythrobacter sp.]